MGVACSSSSSSSPSSFSSRFSPSIAIKPKPKPPEASSTSITHSSTPLPTTFNPPISTTPPNPNPSPTILSASPPITSTTDSSGSSTINQDNNNAPPTTNEARTAGAPTDFLASNVTEDNLSSFHDSSSFASYSPSTLRRQLSSLRASHLLLQSQYKALTSTLSSTRQELANEKETTKELKLHIKKLGQKQELFQSNINGLENKLLDIKLDIKPLVVGGGKGNSVGNGTGTGSGMKGKRMDSNHTKSLSASSPSLNSYSSTASSIVPLQPLSVGPIQFTPTRLRRSISASPVPITPTEKAKSPTISPKPNENGGVGQIERKGKSGRIYAGNEEIRIIEEKEKHEKEEEEEEIQSQFREGPKGFSSSKEEQDSSSLNRPPAGIDSSVLVSQVSAFRATASTVTTANSSPSHSAFNSAAVSMNNSPIHSVPPSRIPSRANSISAAGNVSSAPNASPNSTATSVNASRTRVLPATATATREPSPSSINANEVPDTADNSSIAGDESTSYQSTPNVNITPPTTSPEVAEHPVSTPVHRKSHSTGSTASANSSGSGDSGGSSSSGRSSGGNDSGSRGGGGLEKSLNTRTKSGGLIMPSGNNEMKRVRPPPNPRATSVPFTQLIKPTKRIPVKHVNRNAELRRSSASAVPTPTPTAYVRLAPASSKVINTPPLMSR